MKSLSLHEILTLTSNGDTGSFRELFNRYHEKIFVQINKRLHDADEAKDVAQEVFLYLWINRGKLPSLEDFDSYLYVVVRNKVISFFRKNTSRIAGEKFLLDGIYQLECSSEEITLAKELKHHIEEAVNELPVTMKNCFHLSRTEGKKNSEIAMELNISEQTVKNNISEALKRIRSSLGREYSELFFLLPIIFFSYSA